MGERVRTVGGRAGGISRRTFVKGLAACGAGASLGVLRPPLQAQGLERPAPELLRGSEFALRIGEARVNITGRERTALTINGSLPGPVLRWREGETVTVQVANALREHTSIHWHGILLPANMDGVPGLSFDGIHPGETFTYRFPVRQHGTYWYHSHSGFQEQSGVYGALIIDPRDREPFAYDREHVVLLTDWTDEPPARVFSKLKKQSDYYNFRQRTVADFIRDTRQRGLRAALSERKAWGEMRMMDSDLADVTGTAYTYLLNGLPPAANWTGLFRPGERVRLRVINGSSMTYFDVRIPGLTMTVVAADGQPVHPVTVEEFRIAAAETYDVIVEPSGQEAFTIFAQAMDRTGFAAGTLAVRPGLQAEVPAIDRRPFVAMRDLGMDHDAAAPPGAAADPHAGHVTAALPAAAASTDADPHAAHRAGGDASAASGDGRPADPPSLDHAGHAAPADGSASSAVPTTVSDAEHAGHGGHAALQHPPSEAGNALVDMQTMAPVAKLDDPGIGLRDNGRRVLTYSDLRSLFDDPDGREPGRTIELHLTGHMQRFVWSFDGVKFNDAEPLRFKYGERLRIVLVNDTMMTHPIHLHGMWSDLEDEAGRFKVRKHTIDMPPGSRRSYRVTADALGRWAYHCHMLFHMEAGMFREARVDE